MLYREARGIRCGTFQTTVHQAVSQSALPVTPSESAVRYDHFLSSLKFQGIEKMELLHNVKLQRYKLGSTLPWPQLRFRRTVGVAAEGRRSTGHRRRGRAGAGVQRARVCRGHAPHVRAMRMRRDARRRGHASSVGPRRPVLHRPFVW